MRHVLRIALAFSAALFAVLIAGAAPVPKDAGRGAGSDYFPLTKGTKWGYRLGENEVTVLVTGTEKVGTEECARVETDAGAVKSSELFAVRADGVYRVKVNDNKIDPPVKVLELPVKAGASWKLDSKLAGQTVKGTMTVKGVREKVKTPIGEFEAVLVESSDLDIAGAKTTVRIWFAKGGIVKQEFVLGGGDAITSELTKFAQVEARREDP
jgi:hypothetical protein